jgi:hypothetical protein
VADRKRARCVFRGGLGWERVKVIGPGVVRRVEGLITRELCSAAGFARVLKSNFEKKACTSRVSANDTRLYISLVQPF